MMDAPTELTMVHKLADLLITMRDALHWDMSDLFAMSLVNKKMSGIVNRLFSYNRPQDVLEAWLPSVFDLASYSEIQRRQVFNLIVVLLKKHQENINMHLFRSIQQDTISYRKEQMIKEIYLWLSTESSVSRDELLTYFRRRLNEWELMLGYHHREGIPSHFRELLNSIVKGLTEHNFLKTNSTYDSIHAMANAHLHRQNTLLDFVHSTFFRTEPEERSPFTHQKTYKSIDFDIGNFPSIDSKPGAFAYASTYKSNYSRFGITESRESDPFTHLKSREPIDLRRDYSTVIAPKPDALLKASEEASMRVMHGFFSHYRPSEQKQETFQKSEVKKPVVQPLSSSEQGLFSSNQPQAVIEPIAEIPENFCCPISYELMEEPVQIAPFILDKNNYERRVIQSWLKKQGTSPFTLEKLPADPENPGELLPEKFWFTPNVALKAEIDVFKKESSVQENTVVNSLS